jgi:hypothetical protein
MLRRIGMQRIYNKKEYTKVESTKARKVEKTISFAGRSTYLPCGLKTWVELEDARTAGRGSLAALAVKYFEGLP